MVLAWAPGLQRTQVIRRAARILAIQRALDRSTPDQWRIQELARRMMEEVAEQAGRSRSLSVALRPHTVRHLDLDARSARLESGWLVGVVHVGNQDHGPGPCIHLASDKKPDPACDASPNLLDEPEFWTTREAHDNLRAIVGLDGMACAQNETGPWQSHDPRRHAVHRAAMAAYLCEQAYHDTLTWHNPQIPSLNRPLNPVGMMHTLMGIDSPQARENAIENRFVEPWRAKFEELLSQTPELELQDGRTKTWQFLQEGESHWTLDLCWSIVKQSYTVRLDCPPLVVPLHVLKQRQDRSLEQTLYQYLVDDPSGPRMKAVNAARFMGDQPGNVHEVLSQARRKVTFSADGEGGGLWDPLQARHDRLVPMAMGPSDSAREAPTGASTSSGPAEAGKGGDADSKE